MSAKYTNPRFDPKKNGFNFNNTFENNIYFGPFGWSIRTSGRCGGMSYSALDYFNMKKTVPDKAETPPDGDYIGDYILKRQWDTFASVGDEFITGTFLPNGGDMFFGRSFPGTGQDFNSFVKCIDKNKPCNIGLFSTQGGIQNIGSCHQVLGIGYTLDSDPLKTLIHIYDPNHSNQEMVLRLNINKKVWEECYYNEDVSPDQQVGKETKKWKAWFADTGYKKHAIPPDTSSTINNLSGRDLRNWNPPQSENLRSYRFVGTRFSGNNALNSCDFTDVNAQRALFDGASVSQSSFIGADLNYASFDGANLKGSTFNHAKLFGVRFCRADLSDANFIDSDGVLEPYNHAKADFEGAKFNNTDMMRAKLPISNFTQVSIANSKLNDANLHDANFRFSALNNVNFNSSDLYSADFRNASLKSCLFELSTLSRSDFSNVPVRDCSFKESNCNKAKFANCSIANGNFLDADISFTDFSGAALNNVDLIGVKYIESKWQGASLTRCKMSRQFMSYLVSRGAHVQ